MPGKQCQFLSPSLLTGSEDVFRNAIGGYWNVEESENIEGTTTYELEFIDFSTTDPLSDYFDTIKINTDPEFVENISDTVVFPSKRAPVRILASENIDSDVHWKQSLWEEPTMIKSIVGYTMKTFLIHTILRMKNHIQK